MLPSEEVSIIFFLLVAGTVLARAGLPVVGVAEAGCRVARSTERNQFVSCLRLAQKCFLKFARKQRTFTLLSTNVKIFMNMVAFLLKKYSKYFFAKIKKFSHAFYHSAEYVFFPKFTNIYKSPKNGFSEEDILRNFIIAFYEISYFSENLNNKYVVVPAQALPSPAMET
jgi:hypothetical protein